MERLNVHKKYRFVYMDFKTYFYLFLWIVWLNLGKLSNISKPQFSILTIEITLLQILENVKKLNELSALTILVKNVSFYYTPLIYYLINYFMKSQLEEHIYAITLFSAVSYFFLIICMLLRNARHLKVATVHFSIEG